MVALKIGMFNIGSAQLISLGLGALGLAQMLLSNKAQSHEREMLKADLKKEILDDLMKQSSN